MAQPLARFEAGDLKQRVLSGLALLVMLSIALWAGSWAFAILAASAAGIMAWEWARLCQSTRREVRTAVGIMAAVCVLLVPAIGFLAASTALALGVLTAGVLAIAVRDGGFPMALVGLPYAGGAASCLVALRFLPETGLVTVLWLICIVAATDTGAYAMGRLFGGPRLAPAISPKKTWSGLVGGVTCGALAGIAVVFTFALPVTWSIVGLAAGFALLSQIGDLLESGLKRRYKAKDSGGLIPGHGGVLDRLDGYPLVVFLAAGLTGLAGGSPLLW